MVPLQKNSQVGGAAAYIDQGDPQLHLIPPQNGQRGGHRLKDDLGHVEVSPVATGDHIMQGSNVGGDDMDVGHQAHPGHAERVLDAGVVIHHVFLRQNVDDLLIVGYLDRLRRLNNGIDVLSLIS